ncbi:hypothetical protein [Arthrobacter sp. GMC3]|uniref:hypothetical protein n=1 Tax=Arthrobacter sp. GMC3 TaxID=2058894 RepID=UPI000CE424CF|nr:hypothetical protein [Arthrobacter sp. GMC3]
MSKNVRAPHGIDLNAAGGLAALFALHRGTFGGATMSAAAAEGSDGAGEQAGTQGEQGAAGAAAAAGGDAAKSGDGQQDAAKAWDGKVESLDPAVQKMIADLRKADGDERVAAKTLAAIQKALNPDAKGDEKPDADVLTKALAERDSDAKAAKTELAVFRLAGKSGADADALLDSRAFLAKIAALEPTDTAGITKAIEDAVKNNPKLKAVLAAGKSGTNFTGGSGEGAKPKFTSLDAAVKTHYGN